MEHPTIKLAFSCVNRKMQVSENTSGIPDVSPILINASEGHRVGGLEWSSEQPGAQGLRSSALPWCPAACTG